MELFARCDRETERLLAVTEEGKRYTLGDLCCVRTPPEPCWATWGA